MQDFTGKVNNPKFTKSGKIAAKPLVENMTSFGLGHDGSLYIVESPRQKNGQIVDIRGAKQFTQQDFKNTTVEERIAMMENDPKTGKAYFNRHSERIAKITDTNGDGIFDKRTEFADGMMRNTADGIAFSAIEHENSIYLTCIPHLWKFTDTNNDGIADKQEKLLSGFGPRLSMMGHDMHGITVGPDGRLYWSVGDRGYNVTSKEGKKFSAPNRGAIFRCNTDGTNFEVFHFGLRNPQEIAFDKHGNLFTFDNTGDIGDRARAVYAVESGDSGWYMEHQGLHQYRSRLDHSEFNGMSPWIEDQMFKPQQPKQPLWYLPPSVIFKMAPLELLTSLVKVSPANGKIAFLSQIFVPVLHAPISFALSSPKRGHHSKLMWLTQSSVKSLHQM
ncbi:PQQ-dependent sugar dehydrogenase [Lentisphaera profundi]|uniref:PQQ-dependent sugar dehydrogenase n=1 Tax=Lentisphaera profundi TaxID=1658616 RepID=A0ABY7VSG2_9BACT|nr:PQQ-dependent sugar dehydrogenase [Lentisphaera profundi]WDE96160.1 PQQ-dependent sugar dehydrogenase [Lentisphaera profundi]